MGTLTLAVVKQVADAAERHAVRFGKPFAATVVDPGGHILPVHRQDGVQAAASEVSAAKARAAALFNRPSGALEELVGTDGRPTLLALTSVVAGTLAVPGAVPAYLPAAEPVLANLAGAIGASGGTPEEDEAVARAGAGVLTTMTRDGSLPTGGQS